MATINANVTQVEQITGKLFGNPYFFTLAHIDKASTEIGLNNQVYIANTTTIVSQYNGKFSTSIAWYWYNPTNYFCNIPLNTLLTETKNNYTFSVKRTADKTFEVNKNGTQTTITALEGMSICGAYVLVTTDNVYFGDIKSMSQYNSTVLTSETYYPYVTFTNLSNVFPVYGATSVPFTQANINTGSFLMNTIPPSDPYSGAGDSTTGGGDGTFDGSSDPVPVPNLPSVGAQDSGFITLFTPTASQMKDLAHYMWVNPLFDIETGFKKLFADPMDCILGLSVVPVTIPTSGSKSVNIGNLVTSVTMNVASQQYIEVDCGTVTMDRYFGSYLDFEPYTKISIFLPYCGTHSLNMDDIAGKTIGIVYHIDILTGSCIAFIKCGNSVLYEFNGACSSNIPVNSLNFASTIENAIRIAVNIGTTVATAGASAPAQTATEVARQKAMNSARNISKA